MMINTVCDCGANEYTKFKDLHKSKKFKTEGGDTRVYLHCVTCGKVVSSFGDSVGPGQVRRHPETGALIRTIWVDDVPSVLYEDAAGEEHSMLSDEFMATGFEFVGMKDLAVGDWAVHKKTCKKTRVYLYESRESIMDGDEFVCNVGSEKGVRDYRPCLPPMEAE